jgi:hypothetical protein
VRVVIKHCKMQSAKCKIIEFKVQRGSASAFLVAWSITLLFLAHAVSVNAQDRPLPLTCSYEALTWNVNLKRSVEVKTIRHPYSRLLPEELDPMTGCTVCSEDQVLIDSPPFPRFFVCHKIAPQVHAALEELKGRGAPIISIIGYHVIKSRGPIDHKGNRTGFSNHSFGAAIDINPEQNGLYDQCIQFGPDCRLIRGGERRIGVYGTLEKNDDTVRTLKSAGFRWGGEIAGKQKDFMHFSITGY